MKKLLSDNLWELLVAVGVLSAFVGISFWLHLPAALTLLGTGLITLGLWGARAWAS